MNYKGRRHRDLKKKKKERKTCTKDTVEPLCLGLEDNNQTKSEGKNKEEKVPFTRSLFEKPYLLEPNQMFSPPELNREQRGYPKSDPGGDHYYVGCLGQTRVSLPQ